MLIISLPTSILTYRWDFFVSVFGNAASSSYCQIHNHAAQATLLQFSSLSTYITYSHWAPSSMDSLFDPGTLCRREHPHLYRSLVPWSTTPLAFAWPLRLDTTSQHVVREVGGLPRDTMCCCGSTDTTWSHCDKARDSAQPCLRSIQFCFSRGRWRCWRNGGIRRHRRCYWVSFAVGYANAIFQSLLLFNSLRNEGDPYLGLLDCAKRILDEEGWMTLYRAWWVTLLGGLGSAFAWFYYAHLCTPVLYLWVSFLILTAEKKIIIIFPSSKSVSRALLKLTGSCSVSNRNIIFPISKFLLTWILNARDMLIVPRIGLVRTYHAALIEMAP